MLAKKYGIVNL